MSEHRQQHETGGRRSRPGRRIGIAVAAAAAATMLFSVAPASAQGPDTIPPIDTAPTSDAVSAGDLDQGIERCHWYKPWCWRP